LADFLPQDHPSIGHLTIETVLEYVDEPVLFVARNDLGFPFLAVAVDEVDGANYFLYVPMSEERLAAARTGLVSLREAFALPERPNVFLVRSNPDEERPQVTELSAAELRPEWLPDEDERLGESLETALPFSLERLGRSAVRENRHLFALEVQQSLDSFRTELSLRFSGPIMTEFQELADALAPDSEFALVQLQAASFVIIVAPMVRDRMFASASPAAQEIAELLEAASTDSFGEYLVPLNRRMKAHVRDFFTALSDAGTGVTLFSASPAGTVATTALPLDGVRGGLAILRSSKELDNETLHVVGYLIALNHAKRTFGVRESGPTGTRKRPRSITGKFDPDIDVEGVASGQTVLYRFTILRESEVTEFDDSEVKHSHRMLDMTLLSEQGQTPTP
jgi:hypothetical protein